MRKSWNVFEEQVRCYFSEMWNVSLTAKSVLVGNMCPKKFDLVSDDEQFVGDVKWFSYISRSGRSIDNIAHYIWLLQKVPARKIFLVFNMAARSPLVHLIYRYWAIIPPVEIYLFNENEKEVCQAFWYYRSINKARRENNESFNKDAISPKGCLIERFTFPDVAHKETWDNSDDARVLELWRIV